MDIGVRRGDLEEGAVAVGFGPVSSSFPLVHQELLKTRPRAVL